MKKGFSETDKEKIKRISIIVGIVILLLLLLFCLLLFRKEYKITFDSNGGNEVSSVKVKENDKVTEPPKPTREGYDFAGWYYQEKLYDFDFMNYEITKKTKANCFGFLFVFWLNLRLF